MIESVCHEAVCHETVCQSCTLFDLGRCRPVLHYCPNFSVELFRYNTFCLFISLIFLFMLLFPSIS